MNVTLRIDDVLGKAAKHEAVDAGMSLSKWVMELIKQELERKKPAEPFVSLADAMQNDLFENSDQEIDFENSQWEPRKIEF